MEIDKFSSTPLYIQICDLIQNKIKAGEYSTNQLLPSEMDIQKQYSVSRITARKAYNILMKQGIVRGVRGKGTYVNDLYEKDWTWMNHFSREVLSQGRIPSSIVINYKEITVDEEIANILEIEPQSKVHYFNRVRCIDNTPIWLTKSYIPVKQAEALSERNLSKEGCAQSLFFVLEHDFNVNFDAGKTVGYIGSITKKDLSILDFEETYPIGQIEKVGFLSRTIQGFPIVYEATIFKQKIVKEKKTLL